MLRDLVPFVQFKNVKNTYGWPATLTLLYGCFSLFLNCANDSKSRNAPHIYLSFPLSSNQIRWAVRNAKFTTVIGRNLLIDHLGWTFCQCLFLNDFHYMLTFSLLKQILFLWRGFFDQVIFLRNFSRFILNNGISQKWTTAIYRTNLYRIGRL